MAPLRVRDRERQSELGMSFLDVISCGFGAITILIILADEPVKVSEIKEIKPNSLTFNEDSKNLDAGKQVIRLNDKLFLLSKRLDDLKQRVQSESEQIEKDKKRLEISEMSSKYSRSVDSTYAAGIPVDREYVIFILDTSGSMKKFWPYVTHQIEAVLEIHPLLKGIQIMSDNGDYLLPSYSNGWIPDNLSTRKRIIEKLRSWAPFSNSSPVEGIKKALISHSQQKVALYVFGDDFTGGSYDRALASVARLNPTRENGSRRVKIHGVAFPWGVSNRFATLMRELAFKNDGVFLALSTDMLLKK